MQSDGTGQMEQHPGSPGDISGEANTGSDIAVRQAAKAEPAPQRSPFGGWPESTVLTLQDLLDLPRQSLPEETYTHLVNAGRETMLAVLSLVNSLTGTASKPDGNKTRKHIEVE